MGQQMTIGAVHVGATEIQMCIAVRCDSRGVRLSWTLVFLVSGVEHQFRIVEPQQSPVKLVALARRCMNDFETKYVAVETNRCWHVKDLKQSADSAHFDAHEQFSINMGLKYQ